MGLVRRFCLGQIPAYVDGGAQHRRRPRRRRRAICSPTRRGEVGERYILGGRNFTLDRLFADLARISGVAPPPLKLPAPRRRGRGRGRLEPVGLPVAEPADEIRSASCGGPTATRRPSASSASSPARTRRRSRTPSAGSSSELGDRRAARRAGRGPDALRAAGDRLARSGCSADDRRVLYRCPTRTNVLCPCGAVERRLRKLGSSTGPSGCPTKRSTAPEIEELTGQRRVPCWSTATR